MQKNNRIPLMLILFIIIGSVYAAAYPNDKVNSVISNPAGVDINSCRYTQPDRYSGKTVNYLSDLSGFELKMENSNLAVYFCESEKGIRVVNRKNGYVWGALKESDPEDLNEKWSRMANSLLTIEYFDSAAKKTRVSLSADNVISNFIWEKNTARCSADFTEADISFDFTITLSDDSFEINVLRDTLKEGKAYKLSSVWILPFFGAVREDATEGYMFVPDGCGALIRYDKSAGYVSAYDDRIYGKDISVDETSVAGDLLAKRDNDYLTGIPQITIPVYGAVHGVSENAFIAVIDSGAEYASVYASPAGLITDYNWVSNRFDYRNSYVLPLNKSGDSINTFQEEALNFDCKVTYYLLDGSEACYSGMAVKYRTFLMKSGKLSGDERIDGDIPAYLNVFAADIKKTVFGNSYVPLTTISELEEIIKRLEKRDISNLSLTYSGWQNGGLNGMKLGQTQLSSHLGKKNDLKAVSDKLKKNNSRFYLGSDVITSNEDQSYIGSTVSLRISGLYAYKRRNNASLMYPTEYYTRPVLVKKYLERLDNKISGFSLDLSNIGNNAYADYGRKSMISRTETIGMFTNTISGLSGKPMLSNPNEYLWNYVSEYSDIPMQNSQYLFESDTVPFLQIVLKGSIDYYAPYANQSFYSDSCILKMIEYGAYPSFVLIYRENKKLIGTPSEDYYSLNFNDWEPTISKVYDRVNDALKNTEGAQITEHKVIDEGVVRVSYSNGCKIFVNYNSNDYAIDTGAVLKAQSYLVTRD